ncbi:hypothetical protein DJ57_4055 [Yersinia rochesterensis]|nr:hypothetical protein DJ57_4055 [Yersinia rochesterensis]
MMCATEAVRAGQSHCGVGIDITIAAQHIRQRRIGPVQVQIAQHVNRAAAQCARAAQGGGSTAGNIGLPRQTAVGGTEG